MIILVQNIAKEFTKEAKRYRVIELVNSRYTGTELPVSAIIGVSIYSYVKNSIGLFR